jgi:ATP/maltotriose-dependent transcriptional regulator MalT
MSELPPARDPITAGQAALSGGRWREARARFQQALARAPAPEALEGIGWAAWWLEDVPGCLDSRERAYRMYRRAGDARGAARVALWLGDAYLEFRGATAVAGGWFGRAARILDGLEPAPEHGWLAVFEANAALDRHDLADARRLAGRARGLGRRFGAVDLEMFSLATEGVALVGQGDVGPGMHCLDEATAAALGGEYENLAPAAWTCCRLMSACEELRDYERGTQWCRKIEEFSLRMDTRFVTGVCRAHYAVILTWHGSWDEAERELVAAVDGLTAHRPYWRAEALVRLGDLRRRQGRLAEAEELFTQAPEHPLAQQGLAELSLDRDDPRTARDLLERLLRRIPGGTAAGRAMPLELLVIAAVAMGDHAFAAARLDELRSLAAVMSTPPVRASVRLLEGLLAAAAGDHEGARGRFEDAVDLFTGCRAPVEAARARLELSAALLALGRAGAAEREARAARACLSQAGAPAGHARARAALKTLGISEAGEPPCPLSERQVQVLRLVAEGLGDKDIADRLVLSEHTVHRHVANIYLRLGCSSRAAAVAHASRLGLL